MNGLFNKSFALGYLNRLCKKHKIKVIAWSASSCGRAYIKRKEIKIPKPTNLDRFAVGLHEIFHIIGHKGSTTFEKEFYCDKYALDILIELDYPTEEWTKRMKWHVLAQIAKAHNRGLNHSKINPQILSFFKDIDFNLWSGKKVFVGYKYSKNPIPENIEYTQALSKKEVEMLLNRKGLMLDKSERDDSTYNRWIVHTGSQIGTDYGNLSEIINHYQLAL